MADKVLKIKKPYRKQPNEAASTRQARVRAEQALINAYNRACKEADKADPQKLADLLNELRNTPMTVGVKGPVANNSEAIKLLAGRIERECDKVLAATRRDEIAEEMVRIKLAKWAAAA